MNRERSEAHPDQRHEALGVCFFCVCFRGDRDEGMGVHRAGR